MADEDAYRKQAEAQVKELEARLELLRAKAERAAAQKNVEYQQRLEELRNRHQDLLEQLDEAARRGGEAWEDFKKGLSEASGELKGAVERAVSRFE